ncbi:MAG: hypothetical protein JST53_12655 [Actinobacteria bacterium]|nr:hypothetical protein [Actinomycetota bacterium]
MALSFGLAQQALIAPEAVPDDLLGEIFVLIYRGLAGTSSTAAAPR